MTANDRCEICQDGKAIIDVPAFSTKYGAVRLFVCEECARVIDRWPRE